jgi:Protein of unknown function (DUF3626)
VHLEDRALTRLTGAQRLALGHVRETVHQRKVHARGLLLNILSGSGCPSIIFDAAAESIRERARVIVHFHPDRIGVKPITVAEALLEDGRYRSQFETGLSSGSLTAFPGGTRDTWEQTLFGGAYHGPNAVIGERPKYGALELIRFPDGPWPRFGSCYLVLREEVSWRTSFTFSGSEQQDAAERLGTIDQVECVLAPLLAEVANGAGAQVPWPPFTAPTLGVANLTVPGLLERVSRELVLTRTNASSGAAGRVLDTGLEAQVHGPIDLQRDVERLVADPAFSGTPTGDCLNELSRKFCFPLDWHVGFRLSARDVPGAFRGPAVSKLARRIAGDGVVDAAVIGAAQRSLRLCPEDWRDWGTPDDTLEHLKQLWHVLVHYGEPALPGTAV